jgi:cytoskeletal protein CcmA (bactofilin family)
MAKGGDTRFDQPIRTTLGKETVFQGTMRFSTSLKIDGKFEGEIESDGFLYIEDGAVIRADIRVGSVVVGGIVHGNIVAKEKLEMLSTGRVYGNVTTTKLKIADGVVFEGKCEMIKNPDEIEIFSAPATKLKTAISRVS